MAEPTLPIRFSEKRSKIKTFEQSPHIPISQLENEVNTLLQTNAHRITINNIQFLTTIDKHLVFVWFGERFETGAKV